MRGEGGQNGDGQVPGHGLRGQRTSGDHLNAVFVARVQRHGFKGIQFVQAPIRHAVSLRLLLWLLVFSELGSNCEAKM